MNNQDHGGEPLCGKLPYYYKPSVWRGGGACTKVEIEDEVNPSEYAANEPLYTSSPSSTISGIEGGGGAYLETSGKSPSPGKDHTAVNG